jgi:glycosyltransferase involved in cell wall biosynthesis
MKRKRLAILSTHPIQYHSAWFAALASHPEIDLEVLFCHQATPREQAAAGFGVEFDWDLPLLDGYAYRFLNNIAAPPSLHSFSGLDTPEVGGLIERGRYHAVIVNGWHYKSSWQTMRACRRTGTPVMARGDSHLHVRRHPLRRALKWPVYRWFIPRLDACLAAGKWSREFFLHYGARAERIFLVPHAIDESHFAKEADRLLPERSQLRAKWGITNGETVFLFAGKFIETKRPLDFVQGIDCAFRQTPGVVGLMAGAGPLRAALEKRAGNGDAPIRFTGFLNQSEIARAYVAADALVLPSAGETWGLVVNEAMACGRPCFVSNQVGCGPDLIVNAETGELFAAGDVEGLGRLLSEYARKPDKLVAMGAQARHRLQSHSLKAAVEGVLQALSAVTQDR